MSDEQRIATLEQHVRAIYEQIAALRAELGAPGTRVPPHIVAEPVTELAQTQAPAPEPVLTPAPVLAEAAPPRAERPAARAAPERPRAHRFSPPAEPDINLEKLLGRYGTIAVASLAILMGVGTFLSWAIEHGHLGPTVRVILGFVGAGIVAGFGIWVREKRDVRFGNVLLALSLAIVHVDAWAAGPYLQVLSTVAALTIAAVASAALAALALTSEERTLFAVGFAGALAAPFVTAREPGSTVMLLTYGWVVIALSLFAIRERGWSAVLWLTVVGAAVYVLSAVAATGMGVPGSDIGWLPVHAPVLFAFACAAAGLLFARSTLRSKLALAFLLLAAFATFGYSIHAQTLEVGVSLIGIAASYIIARELETDERWLVVGNIILPLCFLGATIISATDQTVQAGAALALTVIAGLLAWSDEDERGEHIFVAAVASGVAIFTYLIDFDLRCIGALALHAALFSVLLRSTRARLLIGPILIGLLIASCWTLVLLYTRPAYAYTPFLTMPSLCAAGVVAAWTLFAFALKPAPNDTNSEHAAWATFVSVLALGAAFTWVRQELVEAWSPDASTFALIVYYAAAGVALIFAGRWRKVGLWRGIGLAFAFYAGFKAIAETFTIASIGLRVSALILVGAFLTAVAYWYRVPAEPAFVPAEGSGNSDASSAPAGPAATSTSL